MNLVVLKIYLLGIVSITPSLFDLRTETLIQTNKYYSLNTKET